jgi:hypothetical protein
MVNTILMNSKVEAAASLIISSRKKKHSEMNNVSIAYELLNKKRKI